MRKTLLALKGRLQHALARLTRRYYAEDFVRVYPDGVRPLRFGRWRRIGGQELNNYLNHRKFYEFAAQFARRRRVLDIGCGSGYGAEILSWAGAEYVSGCDLSRHAIRFARQRYGRFADFRRCAATDLGAYRTGEFDVAVCSEVLEHLKEYGVEGRALDEFRRVVRPGGLIVIGTPNSEMLADHGFSYDEIQALFESRFQPFCLFENALVPFGPSRAPWERRKALGRTGVVVSSPINLAETVLPAGATPELKRGLTPGRMDVHGLSINTALLHNTHSWALVAVNPDRPKGSPPP